MKLIASFLLLLAGIASARCADPQQIQLTLLTQTGRYPESQLADVYKNFFQDRFGPGHLLADTASAAHYLRTELAETFEFSGPMYEPTGAEGQFMRVNIGLIANGIVPYNEFFDAFVRSVQDIDFPTPDGWRHEWQLIDIEIKRLGLNFVNEESDRKMIQERLQNGEFAVHHSQRYNNAYEFHYRIISRPLFLSCILPYIKN